MPTFKYYNIQLLPYGEKDQSSKSNEYIGPKGYRSICEGLHAHALDSIAQKDLSIHAAKLRGETYFTPREIEFATEYAFGKFTKFDRAQDVHDNLTGEEKYKATSRDASKRHDYNFVFDFKNHILAVSANRLPSTASMIRALDHIFGKASNDYLTTHSLQIEELTIAESLDNVLTDTNTFDSVEVSVTFSNSEEYTDGIGDLVKELEGELKKKNIHERKLTEKAADGTSMDEPTGDAAAMLGLATKFGNATVHYNSEDGDPHIYRMTDFPVKLIVSKFFKKSDNKKAKSLAKSLPEYSLDIFRTIPEANKIAQASKKILDKIRGLND